MGKKKKSLPEGDVVRFVGGLVIGALTVLAALGVGVTVKEVRDNLAVRHWPETTGTVVRAHIDNVQNQHIATRGPNHYEPLVEFTYEVDGVVRNGNNRHLTWPMTKRQATELVAGYVVGETVAVYVDPRQPTRLALDNDPPVISGTTLGIVVSSTLYWAFFAGWLVPNAIRRHRARRTAANSRPGTSGPRSA